MEDKIVLDRKAFGALAVDSRVKILKALRERRKMLTELANELSLSPSSTKEHLEILVAAGLIERIDDGHKWKYYDLTKKGAEIVAPGKEIRVWILLGISVIGFIYSAMFLLTPSPASSLSAQTMASAPAGEALAAVAKDSNASRAVATSFESTSSTSLLFPVLAFLFGLIVLACGAYLIKKRLENR